VDDRWRLANAFRAGPAGGAGLELAYAVDDLPLNDQERIHLRFVHGRVPVRSTTHDARRAARAARRFYPSRHPGNGDGEAGIAITSEFAAYSATRCRRGRLVAIPMA
jgi:hypothetical protein